MFRPWEDQDDVSSQLPKEDDSKLFDDDDRPEVHNYSGDEDSDGESDAHRIPLDLEACRRYKQGMGYPAHIDTKNKKANFRQQCKPFVLKNGELFYVPKSRHSKNVPSEVDLTTARRVIFDRDRQRHLVRLIHEGAEGSSLEARGLAGHLGRDKTIALLSQRYFWHGMYKATQRYCRNCVTCQKVNPSSLKVKDPLHPVGVKKAVMKQIGIDITSLPEVNGKKYLIVAVCYFSKWVEAKAIKDKAASTVAQFIFKLVTRFSCIKVIIHDQGTEFLNSLQTLLFAKLGTKRRVCSAYHPQSNGLVERENRILKNTLLKVLEGKAEDWPQALPSVLFALRVAPHTSTKFSPYFLMYGRHPTLPVDLDYDPDFSDDPSECDAPPSVASSNGDDSDVDDCFPLDIATFKRVLLASEDCRKLVEEAAMAHIREAQRKQKFQYDRRHLTSVEIKVGQKVLLINARRESRKGDKSQWPKTGPYTVENIDQRKRVTLKNEKGIVLKVKHPLKRIVPLVEDKESEQEDNSELEDDPKGMDDLKKDDVKKKHTEKITDKPHTGDHKDNKNKPKKGTEKKDEFKKDSDKEKSGGDEHGSGSGSKSKAQSKGKGTENENETDSAPKINDGESSTDDCSHVSTTTTPSEPWFFRCPDPSWFNATANMFGVRHEHWYSSDSGNAESLLNIKSCVPGETGKVRGDGNCLFRSVSLAIFGTEQHHLTLRKQLTRFMSTSQEVAKYVCGENHQTVEDYLKATQMARNRTWGTDAEIFALAIFLKVDICVFLDEHWQRFSHTGRLEDRSSNNAALYLTNVNHVHYEPVRSVLPKTDN